MGILGLLAACTGPSSDPPSDDRSVVSTTASLGPSPAEGLLDSADLVCADAIATDPPDAAVENVLGVVALPTDRARPALQASQLPGTPARYFAKQGLYVRVGTTFELAVTGPAALDGSLGWGNPGRQARTLQVSDCRGPGSADWLVYAGGYEVAAPGCLEITVTSGQSSRTVRIGVGAPCPGQQPAPG